MQNQNNKTTEKTMQRIFRNGIKQSIATNFPPSIEVTSCILTRSASSQISSQKKWPWARQASRQSIMPLQLPLALPWPSHLHVRCYSIDSDDPLNQNIPNTERKIPKMSDTLHFGAPPFYTLVLIYKVWQIRRYDGDFSMKEFIEGSTKAIEVCLTGGIHLFS